MTQDCLCGYSGVDDLFEMIQSRTFIYQLGYGLIKIFVVNIFPELRPLFRQVELSAGQDIHATGQQHCMSYTWCIGAASCSSCDCQALTRPMLRATLMASLHTHVTTAM